MVERILNMSNQIISAYVNEIIKRFDKVVEVHENRLKYLNMWLNVCQNQNKVVKIVSEALDHEPIRYKDSIKTLKYLFTNVNHTLQSPNIYSYTDNVVTILGEIINKVTKDLNTDTQFRNYLSTLNSINDPLDKINKIKEQSLRYIDLPTTSRLEYSEQAQSLSYKLEKHYNKSHQIFEQIPYFTDLYKHYSSYHIRYIENLLENTRILPDYYFGNHNRSNFSTDHKDKDMYLWLKVESNYIYDNHPEYDNLMVNIKNDLKTLTIPLIDAFLLDCNLAYVNYVDVLCKVDDVRKMIESGTTDQKLESFLSSITMYDPAVLNSEKTVNNVQQKEVVELSQNSITTPTQESSSSDIVDSAPSVKYSNPNVITTQSVVDFWNHFSPQFKWEAIPYNFAYDLFQAWSDVDLTQNEFKDQSIQWCQETNQYIPKFGDLKIVVRDRMDQTEPLIKEYSLTQYENYKPKTTRGYLKNQ